MNLLMRLKLKLLWLRHAYTFHWAHKPLCDRFIGDVLRIGPVHLCRSCVCAYAGIAAGLFFIPVSAALFFTALAAVIVFSAPPLYKRFPRILRDLLRFSSGALIPMGIRLSAGSLWAGLAGLAVIVLFWYLYFKLRRNRKLKECNGCRELGQKGICSGFASQADHVRLYEHAATELLTASGYIPAHLRKTV